MFWVCFGYVLDMFDATWNCIGETWNCFDATKICFMKQFHVAPNQFDCYLFCFEFVGDMLETCFLKYGLKWLKSNKGRVLGLFQTYLKQTQNKFFEFFNLEPLFQWGSLFLAPYVVISEIFGATWVCRKISRFRAFSNLRFSNVAIYKISTFFKDNWGDIFAKS